MFLARSEEAIRQTSLKYGKSIKKIALNICNCVSDAEECENDTYLTAWNTIPPHEPREYFFAYLAKIARAKALNIVKALSRDKRKANLTELTDEIGGSIAFSYNPDSEADAKELSKAVSDFLKTISKEKRIIFMRRYYFFDSVAEVSGRLGISESKVKTTLYRTRNELQAYLEKEGWKI